MHKPPRHIVWDWNGTLQNDVQAAVNGINVLLRARGLPTVDLERHRWLFSFPVRNYYTALGFQLEAEDWTALAHQFITAFNNDPTTSLFEGTRDTLTRLHDQGIGMSILSAAEQTSLERTLVKHGIRDFFSIVSGLDDHGAGSKRHLADALLARVGLPPETVWMIGDTTHDKAVADAMGCPCVLLASGYQCRSRLASCDCPVLDSVGDIPSFFNL